MNNAPAASGKIKCCFLDPAGSGKTTLIARLLREEDLLEFWDPTVERIYSFGIPGQDGMVLPFEVEDVYFGDSWDHPKDVETRVQLYYQHQDPLVVLCFSIMDDLSLNQVMNIWFPALMKWEPKAKILLVGTKSDLICSETMIEGLRLLHRSPIQRWQGQAMARAIGAYAYVECSAMEDCGMEEFRDAILEGGKVFIKPPPIIVPLTVRKDQLKQKRKSECTVM
ncbi:P-loop containing nucleoside triphosphate hydrolase protein [Flagelloscypha sp. PMI_526]|nr:P-loop containing nucleoside triphosphate hydrolase protein [Flagelloscypha sp. PMI_526]